MEKRREGFATSRGSSRFVGLEDDEREKTMLIGNLKTTRGEVSAGEMTRGEKR